MEHAQKRSKLCQILLAGFLAGLAQGGRPAHAQITAPLDPDAAWSSGDIAPTWSVAWGDVDGDGDLDLAVGSQNNPIKIYMNTGDALQTTPAWLSDDSASTRSVAWGDVDGDGDLDLAAGNANGPNKLYLNDNGLLQTTAAWSSGDGDDSRSLAWGDIDGDGDLDLAVGNFGAANKLYLNEDGALQTPAAWLSADSDQTRSLAWGDMDGDGDLDLAAGNANGPNKLYLNDNGVLHETAVWQSVDMLDTTSLAWGDVDGDGYPELAAGNFGAANRIYGNSGGALDPVPNYWGSADQDYTWSIAWGDVDGDGDLDLAAGNGGVPLQGNNKVYLSEGGILQTAANNPWSSATRENTRSIAWGDVDGDGDLDLVAGNESDPNKLYLNNGRSLRTAAGQPWLSGDQDQTYGAAWGDVDGDGDLDLAVANFDGPNKLYLNQTGALQTPAAWTSGDNDSTSSVAWGDVDGDGDLDLAASNHNSPNKLYLNQNGTLQTPAAWTSGDNDSTSSLAWGDVDGDGDLDLAVSNKNTPNQVYFNQNGSLQTTAGWLSDDSNDTSGLAWGDVDLDGDPDLAVSNLNTFNKLYLNDNGLLQTSAAWATTEAGPSTGLAWGDVDGDGDLDLAVSNINGPNQLYLNQNGRLDSSPAWNSEDGEDTLSLAWGDIDGDGDLDLAVGNRNDTNKVYFNQNGSLQTATAGDLWLSMDGNETRGLAWGDVDGDGDLDLAAANTSDVPALRENKVYPNWARQSNSPLDEPAYAALGRPGQTDAAFFFSTPDIQPAGALTVAYTLFDPEGDSVARIYPEFSPNGGGRWLPATPGPGGDGLANLVAAPTGTPHSFVWNAEADLIKSDNVLVRIRVQSSRNYSPILWPDRAGHSPPFRLEADSFIRVVQANGSPVAGAVVYVDGQPVDQTVTGQLTTDQAGLLNPGPLPPGTTLAALALQAEYPTPREAHDGWAYRTYLTNITIDPLGQTGAFVTGGSGEQRLVVRPDQTLILFNVVVSVEWDAGEAYLQDVALAMAGAADFLYDLSDGQMTLGQVAIYDDGQQWAAADIQISAKNVVQPHAFVGGLFEPDQAYLIRVGRSWDGNTANQGNWSQANGYRTLVHEFGHYALGLYDEYFGYEIVNGELAGRQEAYCTGPENREAATEATNVSVMDYHYTSSELADSSRWTAWCRETAQHQLNNGEADWQTLRRLYGDPQSRWQLIGPDERTEPDRPVPGPAAAPASLPFPAVAVTNANSPNDPSPFALQVCAGGQPFLNGAWVTLVKAGGQAIDQGVTDELTGRLVILGAKPADSLQVVALDGSLSAAKPVALAQVDGFIDIGGFSLNSHRLRGLPVAERLQPVKNDRYIELFSTDGNLKLLLSPGSLPLAGVDFRIASPGSRPGPLPAGLDIVGLAYELTASANLTTLERPAVLRLHYDALAAAAFEPESIGLYRWDEDTATWQALPGKRHVEDQEISTAISELGLYALLGRPDPAARKLVGQGSGLNCGSGSPGAIQLYLPFIVK